MAIEEKRGCGYRKVGGTYLIGGKVFASCDRLPFELCQCPTCFQGYTFTRGITKLDAMAFFGVHSPCHCFGCNVCTPNEGVSFIMWLGKSHYPTIEAFLAEAFRLGVSRRIAHIPKDLELGKSVVYLAHPEAVAVGRAPQSQGQFVENGDDFDYQPRMLETEPKPEIRPGIFASFVPTLIERLIWEHKVTDEILKAWRERGITPVVIPDGEVDHAPDTRL